MGAKKRAYFIRQDNSSPFEPLNNEYVEPYQEMELGDLIALAKIDDELALITLL